MAGYVLLDLEIFDNEIMEEYKKLAPPSIVAYNGKIIVRGGEKIVLEGDWSPERLVIIEFPSLEHAKEWYQSDMYTEASVFRKRASKTKMLMVEGI